MVAGRWSPRGRLRSRTPLAWGYGARRSPPAPRARTRRPRLAPATAPQPGNSDPARADEHEHQGDEHPENRHAGARAPVPPVYGSGRPAFSPPTVLRGRGRIFPAPARGTRTPVASPVRAPRRSPVEVFSLAPTRGGEGKRPRSCRPSAGSTRAGVRSKAHRFVVAGRTGCTGSRNVVVIDGAPERQAPKARRSLLGCR